MLGRMYEGSEKDPARERRGTQSARLQGRVARCVGGPGRATLDPGRLQVPVRGGEPVAVPYNGKRRKVAAYGAIATDYRRLLRTYGGFDGGTFLKHLGGWWRTLGR